MNDLMNELMHELENQGLNAVLTHTGGGVMVAFIDLPNGKTIGVNEFCICLYDSDMYQEQLVYELNDSMEYENAFRTLAQGARLACEKLGNS
jgi:hypothetical protein